MSMSDDDRKKLAKDIVKEFFNYIDLSLGKSMRKKLIYLLIGLIIVGAMSFGLIHLPKGLS